MIGESAPRGEESALKPSVRSPCYPRAVAAPEDDPRRPSGGAGDARIEAVVAVGRATRRPVARGTWIAAAVVGAVCALGFVLLALGGGSGSGSARAPAPEVRAGVRDAGCAGGLGLGLGLGGAIGFLLGRRQRSAPLRVPPEADHSSRRRP